MSFVGQVNRVGDAFVRPHDLELTLEPNGSTREAMIERILHLGFEVRVDLVRDDGERLSVQITRDEAERLELEQRPDRLRQADQADDVRLSSYRLVAAARARDSARVTRCGRCPGVAARPAAG